MSAHTIFAQQWKHVYGDPEQGERGEFRVQPVLGDCGDTDGGYIAVGSAGDHSYVVRTDDDGDVVWAYTYDIGDDDNTDHASAVLEISDGSGFIVTGTMDNGSDYDAYLMELDCDGAEQWTNTYGTGDNEFAHDVIEAKTGTALTWATFPGDYIVCGVHEELLAQPPPTSNMNGLMFRTDNSGGLTWARTYDDGSSQEGTVANEMLWALTEVDTVTGQTTADIVAVGQFFDDGINEPGDGYVVRVNGNTGGFGGTYAGVSRYGGCVIIYQDEEGCDTISETRCDVEAFHSVTSLSDPGEVDVNGEPHIVAVGYTDSPGNADLLVVKLHGGDPCDSGKFAVIGTDLGGGNPNLDENATGTVCRSDEIAWGVREVAFEMDGDSVDQYDLAITGTTNWHTGDSTYNKTQTDPFLMTLEADILSWSISGAEIMRRYGSLDSFSLDDGKSLEVVEEDGGKTEGFILCGVNQADPVGTGDPADLFLIKTDVAGLASANETCESALTFNSWENPAKPPINPNMAGTCLNSSSNTFTGASDVDVARSTNDDNSEICPVPSPKWHSRPDAVSGEPSVGLTLEISPNPGRVGHSLQIRPIGSVGRFVTVKLLDSDGRTVYQRRRVVGNGPIVIRPENVSAGSYLVWLTDGERSAAERVVLE